MRELLFSRFAVCACGREHELHHFKLPVKSFDLSKTLDHRDETLLWTCGHRVTQSSVLVGVYDALLTSQVISVAIYVEREKSEKFFL